MAHQCFPPPPPCDSPKQEWTEVGSASAQAGAWRRRQESGCQASNACLASDLLCRNVVLPDLVFPSLKWDSNPAAGDAVKSR